MAVVRRGSVYVAKRTRPPMRRPSSGPDPQVADPGDVRRARRLPGLHLAGAALLVVSVAEPRSAGWVLASKGKAAWILARAACWAANSGAASLGLNAAAADSSSAVATGCILVYVLLLAPGAVLLVWRSAAVSRRCDAISMQCKPWLSCNPLSTCTESTLVCDYTS